jgi:transposase
MPDTLEELAATHSDKRLRICFQDEARIGQKGRVCRRWFTRGKRPPGLIDQRYTFAYLYGIVEAETDNTFALVLPEVNTHNMQVFIDEFAKTIRPDEHVALFVDGAGWHNASDLKFPETITPIRLPPYAPETNPIERVWEYLKERYLSQRLLNDYDAIVDATCIAWNKLKADAGRVASLTWTPWKAVSQK